MAARRVRKQARRSGAGVPAWVWLLGGLLLGFALFAFLFLRDAFERGGERPVPRPDTRAPAGDEAPLAEEPAAPRRPRYDFYTLLPEREVEIPDEELRARVQAEREAPASAAPPAADGARYLLQAGSFTDPARAEELKARIAMAGEIARIEGASIDGQTRHRVILGPYANAQALETAKRRLDAVGVESIAIRAH